MTLPDDGLLTVRVDRPATGGAVGRAEDGRVTFVRHSLPGELVRVAVTETTSNFYRGDAVEVLEASPERVVPPCRYAHPGGCGGCDLQDVSPEGQKTWKASLVQEHLRRIAGVEREVAGDCAARGRGFAHATALRCR